MLNYLISLNSITYVNHYLKDLDFVRIITKFKINKVFSRLNSGFTEQSRYFKFTKSCKPVKSIIDDELPKLSVPLKSRESTNISS